MEPGERLFRHESGRIVAALSRLFGLQNLATAEDVAQDVFCRALEVWKLRGVPENPSAWLMKAAKNRAIDVLRRDRTARTFAPELSRLLQSEWTLVPTVDDAFNDESIEDDRLRMMFSCCDPDLSEETQVALMLSLLCGFTTREIANALLSKRTAIEKRLERGKKRLAACRTLFDLADSDLPARLSAVCRALYLLFNEGYHGASPAQPVRAELCREAMRLAGLLVENPLVSSPAAYALCALMWLHAARLPARLDDRGELVPFFDQDRSHWDRALISQGTNFLDRAASGSELTDYHVEAAIAFVHATAAHPEDTDWGRVVELYDALLAIRPSPVVELNRAIALAQKEGPERGLEAIRAIDRADRLSEYPFYPAALAELELRTGQRDCAVQHFREALALARNPLERRFYEQRVEAVTRG